MSVLKNKRLALVHDELTRRGGAENVLEELIRLYPQADIYALYAGRPQITVDGITHQVKTSFLQRLPLWFRRHPARILPLLPYAAEQIDFSRYDLVISSASAFAKAIVTRANVPHFCYCHTPTRYLWDDTHLAGKRGVGLGKILLHFLRLSDYAAAQRVDYFFANSNWTQQRIKSYYQRESEVVYPPVDTNFFTPGPTLPLSSRPFLCLGRLTPAKRLEQAIIVCQKLELPLTIIGRGREEARLKRLAAGKVKFLGKVSREEVRRHLRSARALLEPGCEDFGLAAAEAQACGIPVIAWQAGGISEIVRLGETGLLYRDSSPESLAEAIRKFILLEDSFTPELIQQGVFRFSRQEFQRNFEQKIEKCLSLKTTN